VEATQEKVDCLPTAHEIVKAILDGTEDERIKETEDGSIRRLTGKVFEDGSACKQTLQGRRKRLRLAVKELLGTRGWQETRPNVFHPHSKPESLP